MYAIIFDLDTAMLQQTYQNSSYANAYSEIRNYLTRNGFTWVQGSGYFGDESVDAVKCMLVVQRMNRKFSWFQASVRDIRMLRIEENNDLRPLISDEEE